MNNAYLNRAKQVISDPQILSVVAAKRAKQLALGGRPMVECTSDNYLDVALLEIAEGLLTYTFGEEPNILAQDPAAAPAADEGTAEENR